MTIIHASRKAIQRTIIVGIIWHAVWFIPINSFGLWSIYLGRFLGPWIFGISLLMFILTLLRQMGTLGMREILYQVDGNTLTIKCGVNNIESEVKYTFGEITQIKISSARHCPQMIIREKIGVLSKDTTISLLGLGSAERIELKKALLDI